jgi:RNA polymerase sigma factor for flagellar operon FliA
MEADAMRSRESSPDVFSMDGRRLHEHLMSGRIASLFRPAIRLSARSIASFEVMARLNDETLGELPLSCVIPFAERSGLITELTSHVVELACAAARQWPGEIKLAIGIFPQQFQGNGATAQIEAAVRLSRFPLSQVQLQIDESAVIGDLAAARAAIERFKAHGMEVILHDAGTGFPDLCLLQALPIDGIKIDGSLIRSMERSLQTHKLVSEIAGHGRALGIPIIADGIENRTQLRTLERLGCSFGQGPFFGPPLAAPDISAWAESWTDREAIDVEECVREMLPIIRNCARRLMRRLPSSVDEEDLMQLGLLGLLQAAQRFHGARPRFRYFALPRIRGSMLDGLRATDTAPRRLRRDVQQVWRSVCRLEQTLGRSPTGREIAAEAGMSVEHYHRMIFEHAMHKTVEVSSESELDALCADAVSPTDSFQVLLDECAGRRLLEAIADLPPRERQLLRLRIEEHFDLRRIATALGISESRVSQLLGSTCARLRSQLGEPGTGPSEKAARLR